jgi:hypothetical protein
VFLPGHNVASLEALGEVLGERGQRGHAARQAGRSRSA